MTACGDGIVIIGDFNTIQRCTMNKFLNLKSTSHTTPATQYEDFGANPFTMSGSNNNILHNDVRDGWAESMDFGYNGGFCEMIGQCSNNFIAYNTIIDCNGYSEYGQGGNSQNNIYAYNIGYNNGAMIYVNPDCQVTDLKFYNNVVVEDNNSRFALGSSNAGAGVTSSEAISHLNLDQWCFLYSGTQPSSVFILKNNIWQISNPLDVIGNSGSKTTHTNNLYKLSGGSAVPVSLGLGEIATLLAIWQKTTNSNPALWDYHFVSGSPSSGACNAISGFTTTDFEGNSIGNPPNAGVYGESIIAESCDGCIITRHPFK